MEDEKKQISTNSDSNLMAALSYVWILSIVMLIIRKDDQFVKFHAKQGTILFIITIIAMALTPLIYIFAPILWIAVVIVEIIGFMKALSGDKYSLPVIGSLASKF